MTVHIFDSLTPAQRAKVLTYARSLTNLLKLGEAGGCYGYSPDISEQIDYQAYHTDQFLRTVGWSDSTYDPDEEIYHKHTDGKAIPPEEGGKYIWEI